MSESGLHLPDHLRPFLPSFLESARELVDGIQAGLLRLEGAPAGDGGAGDGIRRELHSLKGAAMTLGLADFAGLCHGMEDLLDRFDPEDADGRDTAFGLLLEACDALQAVLDALGSSREPRVDLNAIARRITGLLSPDGSDGAGTAADTNPEPREPAAERGAVHASIRVSTRTMDRFLNLAVELVIVRNRMLSLLPPLSGLELSRRRAQKRLGRVARHLEALPAEARAAGNGLLPRLNELVNEQARFEEASERFGDSFREALDVVDPLVKELQQLVMEARLMPVSVLYQRFPRSVRDFARQMNKQVELSLEGEDTRIDKRAIEELIDPLTHLLRNAVDHGLEPPEARRAAGKPAAGRISLRAFHEKDKVVLELADDGRGLDLDGLRKRAVQRGMLTAEQAAGLREHEVYDLVCVPGLSTAERVTELSGRGVGMDVVKRNVEELNGSLEIQSEPGAGTTVRIALPRTLATIRAFLVRCGEQLLAVPVFSVLQSVRVPPEAVQTVKGREAVFHDGEIVPAARLDATLSLPASPSRRGKEEKICLLILKHKEKKIAFLVDEVLRVEEIVMKSLGSHLRRASNVSGSSILGTGEVALIVDVARLFTTAQLRAGAIHPKKASADTGGQGRRRVLLVEDQMTTRLLEKSILEAAGFQVDAAEDGLTALNRLSEAPFDVLVTDVQMPRMDGLTLTKRVKEDERFASLPVIIVTSMEKEEDKRRGLEAGADAYLLKQSFNQGSLIQTIRRLVGPHAA